MKCVARERIPTALLHLPAPFAFAKRAFVEIALALTRGSGYPATPLHQIPLTTTDKTEPTTFARRDRLLLTAAAVALLGLLAVAAWLEPSPAGIGTHQQLGLPPCTFWMLFGRPCPTCGMTTSWAHLVRGHVASAVHANLGGTLLGMLAMTAVPWLLGSARRGRWIGVPPNGVAAAWISTTILVVILIDWVVRLLNG
jgi:hypothetical protein